MDFDCFCLKKESGKSILCIKFSTNINKVQINRFISLVKNEVNSTYTVFYLRSISTRNKVKIGEIKEIFTRINPAHTYSIFIYTNIDTSIYD